MDAKRAGAWRTIPRSGRMSMPRSSHVFGRLTTKRALGPSCPHPSHPPLIRPSRAGYGPGAVLHRQPPDHPASHFMDPAAVVEDEVRELVRRRGLDPVAAPAAVRRLVEDVVAEYDDRAFSSVLPPIDDHAVTVRRVLDSVAGFGPLQPFLDDPTVEEIWVNGPSRVFVARAGRSELTTTVLTAEDVRALV